MTVRPTTPGLTSRTDISRTAKTPSPASSPAVRAAEPGPFDRSRSADQVEISAEARSLHDDTEAVASGMLDGARLKQVSERVANGHYDQPEVVDEILKRMLDEL